VSVLNDKCSTWIMLNSFVFECGVTIATNRLENWLCYWLFVLFTSLIDVFRNDFAWLLSLRCLGNDPEKQSCNLFYLVEKWCAFVERTNFHSILSLYGRWACILCRRVADQCESLDAKENVHWPWRVVVIVVVMAGGPPVSDAYSPWVSFNF
jgi:hypothetical protein